MKVDYLDLQYESLAQTSGWLNQDDRKHFKGDQITLKYEVTKWAKKFEIIK